MPTSIPWDLYRTFLSVLNAQSLSGAARSLGLTQPTVGRHISELESSLGLALFTRSQTGLQPTDAALDLRSQLEEMQHAAASIERSAHGHNRVRGAVRISASEVVGVEVLPPILAPLRAKYPELVIELVLSDAVQDLLGREVDMAVRMTQPQQDLLLAQRVGEVALGFYAHKDYLAARGEPKRLADLTGHSLVGFDLETPFLSGRRQVGRMEARRFRLPVRQQSGADGVGPCRRRYRRLPGWPRSTRPEPGARP